LFVWPLNIKKCHNYLLERRQISLHLLLVKLQEKPELVHDAKPEQFIQPREPGSVEAAIEHREGFNPAHLQTDRGERSEKKMNKDDADFDKIFRLLYWEKNYSQIY